MVYMLKALYLLCCVVWILLATHMIIDLRHRITTLEKGIDAAIARTVME